VTLSRWAALLAGRRPAEAISVPAPPAPVDDEAMVAVLLPSIYATLSTTPRPFIEIATALAPASQAQIRAGLLELQAQRLASIGYGVGWSRIETRVESLARTLPCEISTTYRCSDGGTGRTPTARYLADRYCEPCLFRHALVEDRDDLTDAGVLR
jgi:hypothetical protein